jgi:hypothetical protein
MNPTIVPWEPKPFYYKFQIQETFFSNLLVEVFPLPEFILAHLIMRFVSIVTAASLAVTVCGKEMAKDAGRAAGKF